MRSQPCVLTGHWTLAPLCPDDERHELEPYYAGLFGASVIWWHVCWGPIDPAHVGDKQSQGAYDVGCIVPLCRASHSFYDEHRSEWGGVTGYSEAAMENLAAGYALKWVERGGTL